MMTMEVTDYREAYLQLRADTSAYRSPVKDMTRYIDKMTMIGRKYGQLEHQIRHNLACGDASIEMQEAFETEFSALEYMIRMTQDRIEKNRALREAAAEGNKDLKALFGDFKLVRLAVKAKAMGARAEMEEFTSRAHRQKVHVLVQ